MPTDINSWDEVSLVTQLTSGATSPGIRSCQKGHCEQLILPQEQP